MYGNSELMSCHTLKVSLLRCMCKDNKSCRSYKLNQKYHFSRIYNINSNKFKTKLEFMYSLESHSCWSVIKTNDTAMEVFNMKTGTSYILPKKYAENYELGNERDEKGRLVIHLFQYANEPKRWNIDQTYHKKKSGKPQTNEIEKCSLSLSSNITITWKDMAESIYGMIVLERCYIRRR